MGLQMSSLNGNPLASNLLNPAGGTEAQAYVDDDGPGYQDDDDHDDDDDDGEEE